MERSIVRQIHCVIPRIGMGELFPGFDIAVRSMCVGEESEFVIRHE